jgi:probable transglycosylase isaA
MQNKLKLTMTTLAATALVAFAGTASADEVDYTVQAGDTLSKIAETYLGSADYTDALAAVNHIQDKHTIYVGQHLTFDGVKDAKASTSVTNTANTANNVSVQYNTQATQATSDVTYQAPVSAGYVVLANGNTAGEVGSYAAQQMAARTGVPASTWEMIIARESNGQVNAYNPSGASGLFQTMPGWGSTATVDDQINSAVNAYNNQGLSAWGF